MNQSLFSAVGANLPLAGNMGVLSAAASGLDAFITAQGGDLDRVFGHAGIDPEQLRHPTLSLALTNYCRVLEEAARLSGCDNFGLRYGQQFQPRALGLLGYVGLCSETLEDALRNFAAAFPFHQHSTLIRLVDCGECYRFDYQVQHGAILDRRQDAELTMGMALNLLRHVLGSDWAPRAVGFEHSRPEGWQEHGDVFGAPVHFQRACNSLLVPKSDLKGQLMPERDANLLFLVQDVIRRLGEQGNRPDLLEDASTQIRLALAAGEPALELVAERLELTSVGLQRRLREAGLSFSQLVEQTRRDLALHYLRQRLPISELAPLLGYSETSAFSRAFRRWFGVSPRQWRTHQS
ncbi:AraC-like transcriptional regulator QhpR [Pseudomonas panipatensis]|uniref:AraC-type DNA-binding protein n=1 Tax=Pseudomonas panipatensis TaxID=428992 RepID=A0A1G8EDM0_9PSED|nr:AraC family transcriptional regulator [Pseudomonas panipatensis]SDH68002.1 AraC-type DNA-binding protein [Pseudomonas panipatensis]SMP67597.1 AraC-type DNA-binding protein [Pseudomonas panipatensis]